MAAKCSEWQMQFLLMGRDGCVLFDRAGTANSSPTVLAVVSIQGLDPYGVTRSTDGRSAVSSASVKS